MSVISPFRSLNQENCDFRRLSTVGWIPQPLSQLRPDIEIII
jgi:hypothetical protein